MFTTSTKEYISNEYHLAVLDYKLAHNEDERWKARYQIARLERIAAELFGFDFADELHRKELSALS